MTGMATGVNVLVDMVALGVALVDRRHIVIGLQADRRRHRVRAVQCVRGLSAVMAGTVVVHVWVISLSVRRCLVHVALTLAVVVHVRGHIGVVVIVWFLCLVIALVAVVLLRINLIGARRWFLPITMAVILVLRGTLGWRLRQACDRLGRTHRLLCPVSLLLLTAV